MNKKYDPPYIDSEEKEIIESFKNINLKKIKKPTYEDQKILQNAAEKYIKKETKMNIRIDPIELDRIKKYANKEGLKYSTFIKSIIHKYITGQLIERKNTI